MSRPVQIMCRLGLGGLIFLGNVFSETNPLPEVRGPVISVSVAPAISPPASDVAAWHPVAKTLAPGEPLREVNPRQRHHARAQKVTVGRLREPDAFLSSAAKDNGRAPDPVLNFDGAASDGTVPPDTNGDVGPNHYVQAVNAFAGTTISVYDKSGTALSQFSLNDLWTGSGRPCEGYGYGDPIVLYDSLADRWILTEFALPTGSGTPPWYLCIAVSQTPDPTGAYNLYDFAVSDNFPDYPKYAAWHDAYYMCANEWPVGIYAFDRTRMLAGLSATFQKFTVQRNFMLPSDLDGPTAPPAGAPNYFYTMMDDTDWPAWGFPGVDRLEIWTFDVDFATPANSAFTKALDLPTAGFNYDPGGFSWEVVPQLGTTQRVDAIGEWPMWRLQYRNFGTHETLVGNFAVDVDGAGLVGIRWFELRKSGLGTWAIHQEGTHSPDTDHRWMGSVAMDGFGNIALGYSVSSATMHPAIRYAVRTAADPAGALGTETTLIAGPGSQSGTDRWGDYSSMSVDPADERTFWYTNEYIDTGGMWRTRIGTFQVDMTPPDTPTASSASLVLSDGFTANWSAAAGATTYLLDVSTDAGFATFVPGYNGLNVGNVTAAPVGGLTPGITYYYRVRAQNPGGTSGYSNVVMVNTTGVGMPVLAPWSAALLLALLVAFAGAWLMKQSLRVVPVRTRDAREPRRRR